MKTLTDLEYQILTGRITLAQSFMERIQWRKNEGNYERVLRNVEELEKVVVAIKKQLKAAGFNSLRRTIKRTPPGVRPLRG